MTTAAASNRYDDERLAGADYILSAFMHAQIYTYKLYTVHPTRTLAT